MASHYRTFFELVAIAEIIEFCGKVVDQADTNIMFLFPLQPMSPYVLRLCSIRARSRYFTETKLLLFRSNRRAAPHRAALLRTVIHIRQIIARDWPIFQAFVRLYDRSIRFNARYCFLRFTCPFVSILRTRQIMYDQNYFVISRTIPESVSFLVVITVFRSKYHFQEWNLYLGTLVQLNWFHLKFIRRLIRQVSDI